MRRVVLLFAAVFLLLPKSWGTPLPQPADPYSSDFEKSPPDANVVTRQWLQKEMEEKQAQYLLRVSIPEAVKPIEEATEEPRPNPAGSGFISRDRLQDVGFAALLILAGGLVLRKFAPVVAMFLNARYNPWLATALAGIPANVLAEEKSFAEFVAAFRVGPAPRSSGEKKENRRNLVNIDGDALKRFFREAPKKLLGLRNLLQQVRPGPETPDRKTRLEELREEVRSLKGLAGLPEVLPIWQMACAMEGLLTQLIGKPQNVTLSTLRTIAQGVDLLESLSSPSLRSDLATEPPIRLLAVDDDPISRHAISFALKKALNPPDLAQNAAAALPLCEKEVYDVIFLDVQMPGMDGFELCSRIHETQPNRKTPVVFVTCQSDFEARAKSTLVGGHDLLGKPFLTFEITLKALTLVLRGRLEKKAEQPLVAQATAAGPTPTAAASLLRVPTEPKPVKPVVIEEEKTQPEKRSRHGRRKNKHQPRKPLSRELRKQGRHGKAKKTAQPSNWAHTVKSPPAAENNKCSAVAAEATQPSNTASNASNNGTTAPKEQHRDETNGASANLNGIASAQSSALVSDTLQHMRDQLLSLNGASEGDRHETLAELCLGLHTLTSEADRLEQTPAFRLSFALQGLLRKLLEKPDRASASVIQIAGAALNLLDELRRTKIKPNLTDPPVRIMIVDDDPVARRAITGAIQLSFAKPESIENGEAAVAKAAEHPFDVIFLDVRMPGMDGFEACKKIHETTLNRSTPIVFVTSHTDLELQKPCAVSGGSGFIPKPAMAVEVTLTALTHALGSRLARISSTEGSGTVSAAEAVQVNQR